MAIAKTHVHSTATITSPSPMVNISRCTSIDKNTVETPSGTNFSNTPKYQIIFTMAQDPQSGNVQKITWDFEDEATRDTEYTQLIVLISEVVV